MTIALPPYLQDFAIRLTYSKTTSFSLRPSTTTTELSAMAATEQNFEADHQGGFPVEELDTTENVVIDVELGGGEGRESSNEQDEQDDEFSVHFLDSHHENDDGRPRLTRDMSHQGSSKWGISQAHLLRTSNTVSLSTGQQGGKETIVEERTSHQQAMNPTERILEQWFGTTNTEEQDETLPKQYRLTARPSQQQRSHRRSCLEIITGTRDDCDEYDVTVGAKAEYLTTYLRWTFRTSFTMLLLFSCACFMLLSCAFAIAIHIVGTFQPICINVGGNNYTEASFIDAYALSWTTLSTVGYGHVYPNLAFREGPRCLLINMFCTFESFVGVLFAGFMGAILVGKVTRVQSFAPTTFSDAIVVRYGSGLLSKDDKDDDDDEYSETTSSSSNNDNTTHTTITTQYPFPVLEFRVVNLMHSIGGGEIMNCALNVVASVLESQASEALQQSVLHKSHRTPKQRGGMKRVSAQLGSVATGTARQVGSVATGTARQVGSVATGTAKQVGKVAGTTAKQVGKVTGTTKLAAGTAKQVGHVAGAVTSGVTNVASGVTNVAGTVGSQAVKVTSSILRSPLGGMEREESSRASSPLAQSAYAATTNKTKTMRASLVDEGSDLAPRRIFSHLAVETPAHPFFKRVWNIQHTLDQNSPLLSAKAKQMIADNHGLWPQALNSHQAIREHLHFHEIIVNLSGTCNATGNVVYCQKVYSFVNVNIGYTFVGLLHRRDNGKLGVDVSLLNDVVEQNGGGGEPFTNVCESNFMEATVNAAQKVASTARNVADRTHEQIVDTTQTVADRAKEKVVQFEDMITDMYDGVVPNGPDDGESSVDAESPQDLSPSGAKKTV